MDRTGGGRPAPGEAPASGDPASATSSGIVREPFYRTGTGSLPEDPGTYPFTRGLHPVQYRKRLWTMRQYAGFGSAAETNRRLRWLLEEGQTGLSVAFDLPTQMGYDPDDRVAEGEVGRVGVSVASLDDMDELFAGIPLDRVSTSMTINATAIVLLAFYVALARRRGIPPEALSGTLQNDILKEYAARGTWRFPVRPSLRLVTDVFREAGARCPRFNTISISGYHMREAGCTAVEEVAFTLADGIAYVEAALAAGLDLDDFAGRLSFFFAAHNDLLEEIAKFRAARRLWACIMKDRFHARDERSLRLRFHVQTAGSTLTALEPGNNVVRVTLQALAAVLGGCQSLHTNSSDEALSLPSPEAALLALRTQQILAFESGVANITDPLGGAPCIEALTDGVEARAAALIAEIDGRGGAVRAIEEGFIQRRIHRSAYEAQQRIESGRDVVVGVNRFRGAEGPPPPVFRVDPTIEPDRREAISALRRRRDAGAAATARRALVEAARSDGPLFPAILGAAEALVTMGEMCADLESVFGRHREGIPA